MSHRLPRDSHMRLGAPDLALLAISKAILHADVLKDVLEQLNANFWLL
jgi:hypothetical protein